MTIFTGNITITTDNIINQLEIKFNLVLFLQLYYLEDYWIGQWIV